MLPFRFPNKLAVRTSKLNVVGCLGCILSMRCPLPFDCICRHLYHDLLFLILLPWSSTSIPSAKKNLNPLRRRLLIDSHVSIKSTSLRFKKNLVNKSFSPKISSIFLPPLLFDWGAIFHSSCLKKKSMRLPWNLKVSFKYFMPFKIQIVFLSFSRRVPLCSAGTNQQYFSLTPNQQQPLAPASQQYFSLPTNQHQPQPAEQSNT